jgi:hypothetical protein
MSETISQLPSGTSGSLGDVIPLTQGSTGPGTGTTRKLTTAQVLSSSEIIFAGNPAYAGGVLANGTSNDSAAWAAALAAAAGSGQGAVVVAPVGVSIANITIPANVTVIGSNCQSYGGTASGEQAYTYVGSNPNSVAFGSVIQAPSGTAVVMQSFSNLYDMQIVGASGAICVDATAGRATIHNVDISAGLTGVACGNIAAGSNIRFNHFHHLTGNGIDSPYGCIIANNLFNACLRAVGCVAGSNYNTITGNRAAFCGGSAYNFDGSTAGCFFNTVTGNTSDRAGGAAFWINYCFNSTFSGNGAFRSGRAASGSPGISSDTHFFIGNSTGVIISGNSTSVWGDDTGLAIGYNSPFYAVFDGGGNVTIGGANTCQISSNILTYHQNSASAPGTPTPINVTTYFNLSATLNVVYWSAGRTV